MTFDLGTRARRAIGLRRPVGRRFIVEWLAICGLGVAVAVLGSAGRLSASLDRIVYDHFLLWRPLPVTPDIAIVEIDNASLARLGRWPWPRSVHAQLLDALAKARPAAVVYDILFTEPEASDATLAKAIGAAPTYLPLLLSPEAGDGSRSATLPVPALASAAAALGHINLEVDPDGIVRSVALVEGDAAARWPQLVVPVYRALEAGALKARLHAQRPGSAGVRGAVAAASDAAHATSGATADPAPAVAGEQRFLIPFSRRSADYASVSAASLLAGDVPADALRGKIVFIGATASGLYDRFATPVSGELGPLPGVLIHANVLDALIAGREIEPAGAWWGCAAALVPLAALLAGLLFLSPWRSLLLTGGLCAGVTAASAALLYGARVWMSPVPAVAGLVAVYPLWNWRRLEMTMSYLRRELQRLADEPYLLPEAAADDGDEARAAGDPPRRSGGEFGGDVLERQIALMAQASQRVQDMKRFVWDSLNSVPEPILVTDRQGVVLIANHAARAHCAGLGAPAPEGRPMQEALAGLAFVKTIDDDADAEAFARAHWPALLDPTQPQHAHLLERGIEVRDVHERDHLLRCAPCTNAQSEATGWIAGLVDVTALHAAERHREEALRLLSHDMRSPHASILALVETERGRVESERTRELLARIERYAERALTLADDFVQLARAESQAYVLEPVSMIELAIDASDEIWPQTHAKRIQLDTQIGDEPHWICVDRSLMTRALVNVLTNAVKYSPPDTRIVCTVEAAAHGALVRCTIRDQGYGIPEAEQRHLFERFRRFQSPGQPSVNGTGLGMAFVKTVVTRHGGHVEVDSAPGRGTVLTMTLPAFEDAQPSER
ncbi:CHASE2 domain-containing protein [Trinickia terrae]|uniref:histidine kinase n=1 Tax=Trinickia terrae TaxID=2571161 RepID=A0A4U1I0R0_9BURK|nr:CHASE2 domain-containing protein [Trinickia terrae]TKC86702.1 CHASE2 domain-containing protein [Trinickia terrae]